MGSRDRGAPVRNITWLKSTHLDLGIDFGFFDQRLTGAIDYYYRKRDGLRGKRTDVLIPSELGYALPDENINKDARTGFDFDLQYNGELGGKLKYRVGGNVSYSRGKFISSYNPVFFNSIDQYFSSNEGRWQGFEWILEYIGQFQSQEEINNYPVNIDGQGNRTLLPGDLKYADLDGDGKITNNDRRPLGWASGGQPNMNFGLSIGLQYGNFDFVMDFSGASGVHLDTGA